MILRAWDTPESDETQGRSKDQERRKCKHGRRLLLAHSADSGPQDYGTTGPQDHRTTGLQDLRPHAVPPEKVRGPWSPFCRLVNSSICLTTDCRQNRKVQSAWRKALNYDYRTTRLQDRRTAKPQDKGTTDHGLRTTVPPEEVSGHVVSGPWSSSGFRGPVGPCRLFCGLPDGGVPPPRP